MLNGLLIAVLVVLAAVGLNEWRDGRAVASTEVKGIQVRRSPSPVRPPATATPSSTTTTTTPASVPFPTG